ncbi:MAG: transposase, partial [Phycisphaerae bacterium]|nr:transposase [Phycisphaerae bacterium]
KEYDALPGTLVVRELRYRVTRRGYRSRRITLVTTLLDAEAYPVAELAELYHRRWQAELNLRHLKDTLGMRVLRSKSVAGVERELLAFALVYNLICAVMTVIALHLETTPERVSLIDVLRLLRYGLMNVTPAIATITLNPNRPGRHQPRVVKRRPLGYSRMTRPRAELKRELMKTSSPQLNGVRAARLFSRIRE